MPSASLIKQIPCSKKDLIKMVLDIEKYPEFVPWCKGSKIYTCKEDLKKIEITADLTIGKSFFKETYKSNVTYDKLSDIIKVTNINGPLKYLENIWSFRQLDKNSEIDFHINFELKNSILNLLMTKYFDLGLKKIANAFENRAVELFNDIQN